MEGYGKTYFEDEEEPRGCSACRRGSSPFLELVITVGSEGCLSASGCTLRLSWAATTSISVLWFQDDRVRVNRYDTAYLAKQRISLTISTLQSPTHS